MDALPNELVAVVLSGAVGRWPDVEPLRSVLRSARTSQGFVSRCTVSRYRMCIGRVGHGKTLSSLSFANSVTRSAQHLL